jgi:hypothetical protein
MHLVAGLIGGHLFEITNQRCGTIQAPHEN